MEKLVRKTKPKVTELFARYPEAVREKMARLRELVIKSAEEIRTSTLPPLKAKKTQNFFTL